MTLRIVLVLVAALIGSSPGFSSTPNSGQTGNRQADGIDPGQITESARLVVRGLETEPNRIQLYDPETETTHVVVLTEKTKLTARRKKDFDGRRKLEFADLETGQTVKVTYRTDDGRITSIQVMDKAS